MLYLTADESRHWTSLAEQVLKTNSGPGIDLGSIRPGLVSAFHYYIGTLLLSKNQNKTGVKWIREGVTGEQGGLFSNSFLYSYLERNHGKLVIPEVIFADPAPYIHFNSTPVLMDSRAKFRAHCTHGLPKLDRPLKIMDIGCGHGKVLVDLMVELCRNGRIDAVEEVFLIDPSEAMLNLAEANVAAAFPEAKIRQSLSRFEGLVEHMDGRYDIALASLAIHHMPYEKKLENLSKLRDHIGYFILYELEANNDTPEMHTPEMALSVYQSYGALIDFVFAHDAPVELAISSIDRFLMSEAIYFFIEPRGHRTDYHMLRHQWHEVFGEALGRDFSCLCDSTSYADENVGLFTMIYGRGK